MIEISHLVVNGCSFTYCQGIERPWENGWPALLGKKLGVPVVNLAVGGSGNDSIHRRTFEYFYKNINFNSKPLYVTAFSHATRKEEFFKVYRGKELQEFHGLDLSSTSEDLIGTLDFTNKKLEDFELAHIMNLSYEACERKKIIYWAGLINLFEANNIPYLTGDYMPSHSFPVHKYMMQNFVEMYEFVNKHQNNVGDITLKTKHIPKLDCGHERMEAMPIIADLFYNKLLKVFGEIKVIKELDGRECRFLKLKEFYNERARDLLKHNEWIAHT